MPKDIRCPTCGTETVIKTVKKGSNAGRKFYVCINHSECKGRVPIRTQKGLFFRLFSNKVTPQQDLEIQEFANTLYKLHQELDKAFRHSISTTLDLYKICEKALQEDRDLEPREYLLAEVGPHYIRAKERIATSYLIEKAKESIQEFEDILLQIQSKALSNRPANWYPRKHRKVYDSWTSNLNTIRQILELAKNQLRPPEPLKRDLRFGNDKIRYFVDSLDLLAFSLDKYYIPKQL